MKRTCVASVVMVGLLAIAGEVIAQTIFSDDFESPAVSGKVQINVTPMPGWTDDYPGNYSERVGLWNEGSGHFTTPDGVQAAWVWLERQLTTTGIAHTLQPSTEYTLSFNVGAAQEGPPPTTVNYEAQLLAGTRVVSVAAGSIGSTALADTRVTHVFTTGGSPVGAGETLAIRLHMPSGDYHTQVLFDDITLTAETVSDTAPPSPDPMVWLESPVPDTAGDISMIAGIATDPSGVEYLFSNTVNGVVSGWQADRRWRNTGLDDGSSYGYRVKARDLSVNVNETGWSLMRSAAADASLIFFDSFEFPVVSGKVEYDDTPVPGWINDYSGSYPERVGLWNEDSLDFTTPYGEQAAWMFVHRQLTLMATNIGEALANSTAYTLSFNVGAVRPGDTPSLVPYEVLLLAGTNVMTSVSGSVDSTDLAVTEVSHLYTTGGYESNAGQPLAIRLTMNATGAYQTLVLFDNVRLAAESVSDSDPPIPNPMRWRLPPSAAPDVGIFMIAGTASDASGVEYFFTNTVNGHVSGWQSSPSWTESGLSNGTTYGYKVKARDRSENLNETGWSPQADATADAALIFADSFERPVVLGESGFDESAVPGWINDYAGQYPERSGLWNEDGDDFSTPNGYQAAWVWMERQLTTTNLGAVLEGGTVYSLTFLVGAAKPPGLEPTTVPFEAQLIAGTNVVASVGGLVNNTDLSEVSVSKTFTRSRLHPDEGRALAIRLHMPTAPDYATQVLFDDVRLRARPPTSMIYLLR